MSMENFIIIAKRDQTIMWSSIWLEMPTTKKYTNKNALDTILKAW